NPELEVTGQQEPLALCSGERNNNIAEEIAEIGEDELKKLEYLSLVSKVCTELDNHLGINDKDLVELVISLAEKHPTINRFKSRSNERDRRNCRSCWYSRSRSRSPARGDRDKGSDRWKDKHVDRPLTEEPSVGDIYNGKVTSVMQFACFVQVEGLRNHWEGLVHISELRREGRVADVVSKGQSVKVKVLSFTGSKTSLSMKDVDQDTGEEP
ncbi:ATP-dependent RNA helicase DHX8-like, partial [Carassius auratus]|uniref:ATP-dependent RNA helicase DHX8-like n=1 Tax=Carassius auratus TaxID=7957 RepID=A0A6P6NTV2_CARAU